MPRLILEYAVRATLMAVGTAAVLRIFRVRTAAARHAAWTGVLAVMLLLPAWTAWGPKAVVRLLPAAAQPSPAHALAAEERSSPASWFNLPIADLPAPRPVWNWSLCLAGIYALGVSLLLARLLMGTLRAHALLRRAVDRQGRLTSSACAAPITIGWLRPTVILPEGWTAWPPAQLEAVLTHEREHVRRRDPLVEWLALLNRALFWFHPLAWWLEHRLSALAEEACDAAVLTRGHSPCEYSEYLLRIARSVVESGERLHVWGMAMPGSALPKRIRTILEGRPAPRLTRPRMACAAVACGIVSVVFAAGALGREQTVQPAPTAETPFSPQPAQSLAQPPAPQAAPVAEPPQPAPEQAAPPLLYKDRRLLVFYFDLKAMRTESLPRAAAAAEKFLQTQMQPRDLVALMTFDDAITVVEDFTADRDALIQEVKKLAASGVAQSADDSVAERRPQDLLPLIRMVGVLKEKKLVMYFADAAPLRSNDSDTQAKLQDVIQAAIRANVAFYPIDTRGLIVEKPPALEKEPPQARVRGVAWSRMSQRQWQSLKSGEWGGLLP